MSDNPYQKIADTAADVAGIPRAIVSAVIGQESNWNPYAYGSKGEIGLMQLMPQTATQLGVNAYDPQQNVTGGTGFLKKLYEQYKDWRKALSAYNSGKPDSAAGLKYADSVLASATKIDPNVMTAAPVAALPSTGSSWLDSFLHQVGEDLGLIQQSAQASAATAAGTVAGTVGGGGTVEEGMSAAGILAAPFAVGSKYAIVGLLSVTALILGLIVLSRESTGVAKTVAKKGFG